MSSFGYLKHLPVDFLKIDGSFVKDVAHDPVDRAMVQAINDVGHVMGKRTIGESVDGEMGLAALREIGVDFAQGNWISPPGRSWRKRPRECLRSAPRRMRPLLVR